MTSLSKKNVITLGAAVAAQLLAVSANAYWIRPIFGDGTQLFQDGLDINGLTQDVQTFNDAARSYYAEVDIDAGTVGAYASISDGGVQTSGLVAFSNALYGETITFNANAPSIWEFSLEVDGYIDADVFSDPNGPGGEFDNVDVNASIAIFEGNTAGTLPLEWASQENLATALFYDDLRITSFADGGYFEEVATTLGGSLAVNPGDSFDVVVRLWTGCIINDNETGYCDIDFSNTAGFTTNASSDSFTSTSGAFLGSEMTVVPLPPAAWLFGSAIIGMISLRRKQ